MVPYNAAVSPVWRGKIAVEEAMNLPDLAKNVEGAPSYSVGGLGVKCKLVILFYTSVGALILTARDFTFTERQWLKAWQTYMVESRRWTALVSSISFSA
jgi:hypothetical protein